jgi:hypothetical protein
MPNDPLVGLSGYLPPPDNTSHLHHTPPQLLPFSPGSLWFNPEISNVRAEPSPVKTTEKDVSDMPVERTDLPFEFLPQFFRDMTQIAMRQGHRPEDSDPREYDQEEITKEQLEDLQSRIKALERFQYLTRFDLPSTKKIEQYLLAFFKYFVPHSPIVHVRSFNFETCFRILPSSSVIDLAPTLLSILSLGAWFLDDHKFGHQLHEISRTLLGNVSHPNRGIDDSLSIG